MSLLLLLFLPLNIFLVLLVFILVWFPLKPKKETYWTFDWTIFEWQITLRRIVIFAIVSLSM